MRTNGETSLWRLFLNFWCNLQLTGQNYSYTWQSFNLVTVFYGEQKTYNFFSVQQQNPYLCKKKKKKKKVFCLVSTPYGIWGFSGSVPMKRNKNSQEPRLLFCIIKVCVNARVQGIELKSFEKWRWKKGWEIALGTDVKQLIKSPCFVSFGLEVVNGGGIQCFVTFFLRTQTKQ